MNPEPVSSEQKILSTPAEVTPLPHPKQKSPFLLVGLVVLLLVTVAGTAYSLSKKTNDKIVLPLPPIASSSPIVKVDETANWEIYQIDTNPYSFKYPLEVEISRVGEWVIFALEEPSSPYTGSYLNFMFAENKNSKTIEEFIQNYDAGILSKEVIAYNNVAGYKASTNVNTYYFLKHPNEQGIAVFRVDRSTEKSAKIISQILSTFKFVTPNISDEISFTLPPGWQEMKSNNPYYAPYMFRTDSPCYTVGVGRLDPRQFTNLDEAIDSTFAGTYDPTSVKTGKQFSVPGYESATYDDAGTVFVDYTTYVLAKSYLYRVVFFRENEQQGCSTSSPAESQAVESFIKSLRFN